MSDFIYTVPGQNNQPQQQPLSNLERLLLYGQQQPAPQQQDQYQYQLNPQQLQDIHQVKLRQAHAQARIQESELILRGLSEIRTALTLPSLTVAAGDTGSKDRPQLEPAFNEMNRIRLQGAYLRMTERIVNHVEFFMASEQKMPLTNEIKRDSNFKLPEDGTSI